MKKFKRAILIIISFFVLLFGGVLLYLQTFKPKLKGSIELAEIESEVQVYYDNYGIPHIYAGSAKDAYYTFGYVHAADRLFQMELMRSVGAGRLSELFGEDLVKTDMFFRTLGTHRKAKQDAEKFDLLPAEVKNAVTAYVGGVNAFIENGKLPIEYTFLGIKPRAYTVEDMYSIAGYMAYSFAFALRTDPLVEKLNEKLGYDYLKDFDMAYPIDSLWKPFKNGDGNVSDSISSQSLAFLDRLPVPVFHGSNAWVVGPKNTASGKVIYANDTHIKYASPAVWYETHISYPDFEMYGNFLAGIPVALVGHTRNHAWGLTMFEDDDSDFFRERFATSDSSQVERFNTTEPVEKYRETISVKDGNDTSFTVYTTSNRPIINEFLPVQFDEPISMYWNYTAFENELIQAFYTMNYAAQMEEFKQGVSLISSPGLNVSYGDASGDIGMWSASKLIARPEGEYGKLFINAFDSAGSYSGYLPFSENPQYENPESGYIQSANNFHAPLSGNGYPGYYAPDTRFNRIGNLLEKSFPATSEKMKEVVLDTYSATAHAMAKEISKVLKNSKTTFTESETKALDLLTNWNGYHELTSREPVLFYKMLYHTMHGMLADEMGDEIFNHFLNTHLFSRSYPKLLFAEKALWWNDINRPDATQNREDIVVEAFQKSVKELVSELGSDTKKWEWKNVHSVKHEHPMGSVGALEKMFNVGPFPSVGGIETVNNGSFMLTANSEYVSHYGPAMRIIIDFDDIENAISVLPTGNSGNPFSKHYKDQGKMFVNGEFRKMMMNKDEIVANSSLLKIKPR